MYESTFETDWDSITQEEAMFRAFAIGVDDALGHPHPGELRRLSREFHRALIEIAYDEGKSRAEDEIKSRGHDPRADDAAFEPSEYEWEVWDSLVAERRGEPDTLETVAVRRSRETLPASLRRPGLLGPRDDDVESIELPRFLLR